MKRRVFISGAGTASLLACGPSYERASQDEVNAAFYHHGGPPQIALLSMVSTGNDVSEHAGIMVNGSQRILYDPAGTYDSSQVPNWKAFPRRNDIHYGLTDRAFLQYKRFHARVGYYVHQQTVTVPLEVANRAIRLCEERGETKFLFCAQSASWVLKQLPGFTHIKSTFSPENLRRDFAKVAGVVDSELHESDAGKNYQVGDPDDTAPPPKPEFNRGEI